MTQGEDGIGERDFSIDIGIAAQEGNSVWRRPIGYGHDEISRVFAVGKLLRGDRQAEEVFSRLGKDDAQHRQVGGACEGRTLRPGELLPGKREVFPAAGAVVGALPIEGDFHGAVFQRSLAGRRYAKYRARSRGVGGSLAKELVELGVDHVGVEAENKGIDLGSEFPNSEDELEHPARVDILLGDNVVSLAAPLETAGVPGVDVDVRLHVKAARPPEAVGVPVEAANPEVAPVGSGLAEAQAVDDGGLELAAEITIVRSRQDPAVRVQGGLDAFGKCPGDVVFVGVRHLRVVGREHGDVVGPGLLLTGDALDILSL